MTSDATAQFQEMAKNLEQITGAINGIISNFRNGEQSEMRAQFDHIRTILLEHNLAYYIQPDPSQCGVHPQNRDGMGLDVALVQHLAKHIPSAGWSVHEISSATCFESGQGSARDKVKEFNNLVSDLSDGFIPKFGDGQVVKYATVASSHTMALIRAIRHGCCTTCEEYAVDGKFSKEKVLQACPSMRDPIESGFRFCCIRHEVELACPGLPDFIQACGNVGNATHRPATKIQAMKSLHAKLAFFAGTSLRPEEQKAKAVKAVEQSCPHFHGEVDTMADFVILYSGGRTPQFLNDLATWDGTLAKKNELPIQLFKILNELDFKQGPEYMMSILKASMAAPAAFVKQGVAKVVTSSDIAPIKKVGDPRYLAVQKVCSYIRSAKEWLDKLADHVSKAQQSRILGNFEINSVMHIHKKRVAGRREYKNVDEIANKLVEDVFALYPDARNGTLPWMATPATSEFTETDVVLIQPRKVIKGKGKKEQETTAVTIAKFADEWKARAALGLASLELIQAAEHHLREPVAPFGLHAERPGVVPGARCLHLRQLQAGYLPTRSLTLV
ncbi:unnamed protein product [Prorocentrum cordatum]|uniref:Uncharacterized protein n=1 Tax=Prorocentrum cordatum TaxID=2364126 RepID=A0ABN9SYN9_9DINO|nr:unnamed protein product [Polarella glacialis]